MMSTLARPLRSASRRSSRWVLVVALACTVGCRTLPPRVSLAAEHGVVRAESVAEANVVGDLLDDLAPRVRLLLPDTRSGAVEVWVQRRLEVYRGWPVDQQVPAFTIEDSGRIHVQSGKRTSLSSSLSHELVHSLLGPSWRPLPSVVEEGLADWVQEQLHPRYAAAMRADHLAKASAAFGGLELGVWSEGSVANGQRILTLRFPEDEQSRLDPVAALRDEDGLRLSLWQPYDVSVSDPRLYGIGYVLVARIVERSGVDGLHALCRRATAEGIDRVPPEWLLEAARLDRSASTWMDAIESRIGVAELYALGRTLVATLVDRLVTTLEPLGRFSDGEDVLTSLRPRLGLLHGSSRIRLVSLRGLWWRLRRAWP